MRTLSLIASALTVSLLAGCASSEKFIPERSMKQLDSSTFELQLQQPWVEQEVIVRDNARQEAIDFCGERNQGMQPLQAISRSGHQTGNGAKVTYTFRCVGYLDAPKQEYHRLGFYTDEESKKEAIERNRDEYGF